MAEKCQMLKENAKDKNPIPTKIPNVKKSNLKQCQQKCINASTSPKKMRESGIPPQKKGGKQIKKAQYLFDYLTILKKKKVETNSHRKIPRYKIHDATPVPPCKLVFFATLVPRFVSQALFAWRAPWQEHFQLSFGDLATIWKKTTFGIEWNWGLPDFSPSSFTGNSWTSLTIFEQWDVAVLAMKGGSPHLTTANKIQRFFFFNMAKQHSLDKSCKSSFRQAQKNVQGRIWIVSNPPWEWHSWNSGCTHPWL